MALNSEHANNSVHIRQKAGRTLGNQFYSHTHRAQFREDYVDPQSKTLCGSEATTRDMSWSETQWAKSRAYVTCQACVTVRVAAGVRN